MIDINQWTTWQGCSDPKTDPYTIKAAVRKTEQRQVVVYKKQRLMTPTTTTPPPSGITTWFFAADALQNQTWILSRRILRARKNACHISKWIQSKAFWNFFRSKYSYKWKLILNY